MKQKKQQIKKPLRKTHYGEDYSILKDKQQSSNSTKKRVSDYHIDAC